MFSHVTLVFLYPNLLGGGKFLNKKTQIEAAINYDFSYNQDDISMLKSLARTKVNHNFVKIKMHSHIPLISPCLRL